MCWEERRGDPHRAMCGGAPYGCEDRQADKKKRGRRGGESQIYTRHKEGRRREASDKHVRAIQPSGVFMSVTCLQEEEGEEEWHFRGFLLKYCRMIFCWLTFICWWRCLCCWMAAAAAADCWAAAAAAAACCCCCCCWKAAAAMAAARCSCGRAAAPPAVPPPPPPLAAAATASLGSIWYGEEPPPDEEANLDQELISSASLWLKCFKCSGVSIEDDVFKLAEGGGGTAASAAAVAAAVGAAAAMADGGWVAAEAVPLVAGECGGGGELGRGAEDVSMSNQNGKFKLFTKCQLSRRDASNLPLKNHPHYKRSRYINEKTDTKIRLRSVFLPWPCTLNNPSYRRSVWLLENVRGVTYRDERSAVAGKQGMQATHTPRHHKQTQLASIHRKREREKWEKGAKRTLYACSALICLSSLFLSLSLKGAGRGRQRQA